MAEPAFREIQLSGKQIVFLFMAGAVAAVVFFLLGVSVGRGVVTDAPATPAASSVLGDPATPTATPSPDQLGYHGTLQNRPDTTPPPMPTPTAPAASAQTKPDVVATPTPTPTPAAKPSPSPAAKPSPTPAPPKPTSAPAAGSWYVQTGAFASRENASKHQAELKAKGFDAAIFTDKGSSTPFRVRMGPMDRPAADALMARLLKEGFKSSPVR